jgi:hypothetical protein
MLMRRNKSAFPLRANNLENKTVMGVGELDLACQAAVGASVASDEFERFAFDVGRRFEKRG